MEVSTVSIAAIAGVVTVATAAIYVLGWIAVGWPLYKQITKDAPTTIYALSLIPKAEIAGYGVKVFGGGPLITALLTLLCLALSAKAPFVTALIALSLGLIAVHLIVYPKFAERVFGESLASIKRYLYIVPNSLSPSRSVLLNLPSMAGTAFAYIALETNQLNTTVALVAGTIASYISGLLFALARRPALPSVEITGESTIVGKLLTHSGGFWYLFDNQGALIAIPDSKTDAARIYGRALLEDQDTSRKSEVQKAAKVKQAWDNYWDNSREVMKVMLVVFYFIVGLGVVAVALLLAALYLFF